MLQLPSAARSLAFRPAPGRPVLLALLLVLTTSVFARAEPPPEAAPEPDPERAADLVISPVQVVDVAAGRVLRDRAVAIRDGRILAVSSSREAPEARQVLAAPEGYLIPGLLDAHAHLRGDRLPAPITTDWMMPLFLAHGVTGVREMTSDCDGPEKGPVCIAEMRAWQGEIEAGERLGPRLLALSSFRIDPPWEYEVTREQIEGLVAHEAAQGVDFLKVYDRLSPEAFGWLAAAAAEHGLGLAGHVPLRMTVREASEAGLRSVEHARALLMDCYPGSAELRRTATSTALSPAEMAAMVQGHDAAACREILRALADNGTAYVPTHGTRRWEGSADDPAFADDPRTRYLPAPMLGSWKADAARTAERAGGPGGLATFDAFYQKGLTLTRAAHEAGVRVLVGTDGGDTGVFPGSGVHDELEELVRAGLTPAEALRTATSETAEFLERREDLGAVEAGLAADLVLLEGNPLEDIGQVRRIRAVIFRGELLDRERLDGLLAGAEALARQMGGGPGE